MEKVRREKMQVREKVGKSRHVSRATTACTFSTSQLPKVVRTRRVFATSYLKVCFAPQRRALLPHLNFQKCSDPDVIWHFLFQTVLRATTACTFSTSQLPKVLRPWRVLPLLNSKCASRHNGVQFLLSPLPSCLRTRCFSEPTFRPNGSTQRSHKTLEKQSVSRLSYLFAHLHLLSSDFLHLWASAELRCIFMTPYCRKFRFQTSFDK